MLSSSVISKKKNSISCVHYTIVDIHLSICESIFFFISCLELFNVKHDDWEKKVQQYEVHCPALLICATQGHVYRDF